MRLPKYGLWISNSELDEDMMQHCAFEFVDYVNDETIQAMAYVGHATALPHAMEALGLTRNDVFIHEDKEIRPAPWKKQYGRWQELESVQPSLVANHIRRGLIYEGMPEFLANVQDDEVLHRNARVLVQEIVGDDRVVVRRASRNGGWSKARYGLALSSLRLL
jgi:hypothetical protein